MALNHIRMKSQRILEVGNVRVVQTQAEIIHTLYCRPSNHRQTMYTRMYRISSFACQVLILPFFCRHFCHINKVVFTYTPPIHTHHTASIHHPPHTVQIPYPISLYTISYAFSTTSLHERCPHNPEKHSTRCHCILQEILSFGCTFLVQHPSVG